MMKKTIEQTLMEIDNELTELNRAKSLLLKKSSGKYNFELFMKQLTDSHEEYENYIRNIMLSFDKVGTYKGERILLISGHECSGKTTFASVIKALFPRVRVFEVGLISEPTQMRGEVTMLPIYNSIGQHELIENMDELLLSDYDGIREWMYGK
ncbi:hypothetical protein ACV3VG_11390 [Clostridium perfringens]